MTAVHRRGSVVAARSLRCLTEIHGAAFLPDAASGNELGKKKEETLADAVGKRDRRGTDREEKRVRRRILQLFSGVEASVSISRDWKCVVTIIDA